MFRKLGYQSDFREIRADEASWFVAVDVALSKARTALEEVARKKGNR